MIISEVKNCQIIEKVLEEVLGKRYRLKCQIKEKTKELKNRRTEGQGDLEKAAKEVFEIEG